MKEEIYYCAIYWSESSDVLHLLGKLEERKHHVLQVSHGRVRDWVRSRLSRDLRWIFVLPGWFRDNAAVSGGGFDLCPRVDICEPWCNSGNCENELRNERWMWKRKREFVNEWRNKSERVQWGVREDGECLFIPNEESHRWRPWLSKRVAKRDRDWQRPCARTMSTEPY
jgi:hypothetical protein